MKSILGVLDIKNYTRVWPLMDIGNVQQLINELRLHGNM